MRTDGAVTPRVVKNQSHPGSQVKKRKEVGDEGITACKGED